MNKGFFLNRSDLFKLQITIIHINQYMNIYKYKSIYESFRSYSEINSMIWKIQKNDVTNIISLNLL